ncbi:MULTISPECIES: S26 family signal peptidase [Streptomyces]|uniref:S26 family signal peptidase n=1 Tax=Streptomyces lycii TaxID=2654337 RepID=A0ABQ7FJ82_9ACTN|nr:MULTISPECIES: S26 family signal peptidase [Streptomyces]KAF4408028.1 S26 family signal peptidase [Streptomyces lycii]PGH51812.1 S26 family signal peptidase [Streptomyces sp. Ru87]
MGPAEVTGALLLTALVTAVAALRWIRRNITVVRVVGPSMRPVLREGDKVIARRVHASALRTGDVAVLHTATGLRMTTGSAVRHLPVIKRVAALPGDPVPEAIRTRLPAPEALPGTVPAGCLLVLGDNPEQSVDSRDYGLLSLDTVEGRVVRKLRTQPEVKQGRSRSRR